ncbi:hypothetical protein [Erythrobacter alti]|uniref:hypothetical protein n=1 Tax=Erythrobacter alti TaxID=1896145 RepID=UPI0030F4145E
MEQQAKMQTTQGAQQERTLTIKCTPTLVWYAADSIGATMAYEETASNPNMPNAVNPVTGDISIRHMPQNARFTDNIDITLVLDTSQLKDQNGNPLTGSNVARWALPSEGGTYTEPSGQQKHFGYFWFCQLNDAAHRAYDASKPVTIDGMEVARTDDLHILIDDDTPSTAPAYAFCMAFVLPEYNNYYITIDPVISSRGVGNEPPMMLND